MTIAVRKLRLNILSWFLRVYSIIGSFVQFSNTSTYWIYVIGQEFLSTVFNIWKSQGTYLFLQNKITILVFYGFTRYWLSVSNCNISILFLPNSVSLYLCFCLSFATSVCILFGNSVCETLYRRNRDYIFLFTTLREFSKIGGTRHSCGMVNISSIPYSSSNLTSVLLSVESSPAICHPNFVFLIRLYIYCFLWFHLNSFA